MKSPNIINDGATNQKPDDIRTSNNILNVPNLNVQNYLGLGNNVLFSPNYSDISEDVPHNPIEFDFSEGLLE